MCRRHYAPAPTSELHLLTAGLGTGQPCRDVRIYGLYWWVTGPSSPLPRQLVQSTKQNYQTRASCSVITGLHSSECLRQWVAPSTGTDYPRGVIAALLSISIMLILKMNRIGRVNTSGWAHGSMK